MAKKRKGIPPFTGNEGASIPLTDVKKLNKKWVDSRKGFYSNDEKKVIKAYFFGSRKILQELAKPGAVGIRIYYGVKNGKDTLMMVAARANWSDIATDSQTIKSLAPSNPPKPCPTYCP